jgi:hypothetical protein
MASLEAKGIQLFCTPPPVCLPGTAITGRVSLDVQEADLEQLRVKWRGRVFKYVSHKPVAVSQSSGSVIWQHTGNGSFRWTKNVDLFKEEQVVWTRSHAGPTTDLHFTFKVPDNPLPSYLKRRPSDCTGSVLYYIEVVADRYVLSFHEEAGRAQPTRRPGLFHSNRRLRLPITVYPREVMDEALLPLIPTWSQDWRVIRCQEFVRQKLWHDKADIQVSLHIPQLATVPALTSVPFRISIESVSRLQKPSEEGAAEFPCPPKWPDLSFQVVSTTTIRAKGLKRRVHDDVDALFGQADEDRAEVAWEPDVDSKSDGGKGRYRHRVEYSGHLRINTAPSFFVEVLRLQHELRVKLKFGVLAKVELLAPLEVTSGRTDANTNDAGWTTAADGLPYVF